MSETKYLDCVLEFKDLNGKFCEHSNMDENDMVSNEVCMLVKVVDDKVSDAICYCMPFYSGRVPLLEQVEAVTSVPIKKRINDACLTSYDDGETYCLDVNNVADKLYFEEAEPFLTNEEIPQKFIGEQLRLGDNLLLVVDEISEEDWKENKAAVRKLKQYKEKCIAAANIYENRYKVKNENKDMLEYKKERLDRVGKIYRPEWEKLSAQERNDVYAKERAKEYERIIPEIIPYRALVQKLIQARKQH